MAEVYPSAAPLLCGQCQAPLPPAAEFCAKCGTRVLTRPPGTPEADGRAQAKPSSPRRILGIVVLVFVILLVYRLFSAASGASTAVPSRAVLPASTTRQVEYRFTGDGTRNGSVTYTNADGGIEQNTSQLLNPTYTKRFTAPRGTIMSGSVQNGNDTGSVTCELVADGAVFKDATSRGAYAIASCAGTVP